MYKYMDALPMHILENKPLEKTEGAIKNEQSRNTGNIGYTRNRTETNKAKTQHRKLKR